MNNMKKGILILISVLFLAFLQGSMISFASDEVNLNIETNLKGNRNNLLEYLDDIPSRLFIIRDNNGKEYFCLDEGKFYPENKPYNLQTSQEIQDPKIDWIISNYFLNAEYFGDIPREAAYSATQLAIWAITNENTSHNRYITGNNLVMKIINDANNNKYTRKQNLENKLNNSYIETSFKPENLELVDGNYVQDFTVKLADSQQVASRTLGTNIQIEKDGIIILDEETDITKIPGVSLTKDAEGNKYTLIITNEAAKKIKLDNLRIKYTGELIGEEKVTMRMLPNDEKYQPMGYISEIFVKKRSDVDVLPKDPENTIEGDLNNDGKVTLLDLALLKEYLDTGNLEAYGISNEQIIKRGDINGDGKISLLDLALLKLKIDNKN
ncbi:dockerin type I domain-containing protein [Enterococcus faecalis]|uniref:dockerin type I domain-containing protein n=1 Tax=Enterococcus faecalis TaxID=1351 RepID=UPI001EEE40F9|nr:dockerin type I domain-containing protein [Enterococcus faecalis]BDC77736.1 hypothetical protein EFK4_26390 [Enterococcus faecalis]